jgi:hypothetical protein
VFITHSNDPSRKIFPGPLSTSAINQIAGRNSESGQFVKKSTEPPLRRITQTGCVELSEIDRSLSSSKKSGLGKRPVVERQRIIGSLLLLRVSANATNYSNL